MIRTKCVICDNYLDKEFLSYKMPVFMGTTTSEESIVDDMVFCECPNCGNIQLKNLIDLNLLYQNNHNIDIVGKTWENHYKEFSLFILKDINKKTILEISDPSGKLAKKINTYKKWYIVEPNPNIEDTNNIKFIKKFFDDDFNYDDTFDIIVHSHLLEHIYDPLRFLKKCHQILPDNGLMFFSVPNLEYLTKINTTPNSILHFEHTYFFNEDILNNLLNKSGFEIVEKNNYENHSIFLKVKKTKKENKKISLDLYKNKKDNFIKLYDYYINKIKFINDEIRDGNIFLYGSHVNTQFLIYNQLNLNNIIGILDGSKSKENKKLYGTNLYTFNPKKIENMENVKIICSHMGIYYEEIKKNLLDINEKIILL